jgi:hypothetical protein
MTNPEAPSTAPVAWCRSDDFSDALQKVQSFSGWREQHPDCDMPLYAHPQARAIAPAADHAEGPSVDDVDELCQEFGFHPDSDDGLSLSILRDMITAAITRWSAPVAQFGDSPEPDPCLEEVVGYVMGWHEIDGKRIRLTIEVLEPCPETEWRPIARKALKRLTAPPVAQPPAQPVNLAELHDPDFSGGLTPSQHLDVVHGGADPRTAATASAGPPEPGVDHVLRLAEIIREVDLQNHSDTFVIGAAALAEAILAHPGFSGCHDGPVAAPEQAQGVLEDRYEFSVVDNDDCEVAGGSAPTLDDAIREARNYLRQYNQDGPHKLELRRVLVLDCSEPTHA